MAQSNPNPAIDLPAQQPGSEKGFYLNALADGAVLDIETQHHRYRLVKGADTHVRISGHPTFCPEPIEVDVEGSIAAGRLLAPNPGFIGRGMYLVFKHPLFEQVITTSRIREIHKLS
ncbi:MAG TPA: hypothetical protein VKO18_03265 [Terriglobia bacterium]|nr:hypothetical protein [Terriglobia bacterium]